MVGGSPSKQVQSINFDGVTDLTQAKQKQWVMLGSLTYDVYDVGVQFYENNSAGGQFGARWGGPPWVKNHYILKMAFSSPGPQLAVSTKHFWQKIQSF